MLTKLEDQILLSVWQLGQDAYGVRVYQHLEKTSDNKTQVGVVYFALDRLAKKGLLDTRIGEPTAVRGGMRKKYYQITDQGLIALKKSKETQDRVWKNFSNYLTDQNPTKTS
jgi:DNA-binding PadR family transcriptional regulator